MIGVVADVAGGSEVLAAFVELEKVYTDLSPVFKAVIDEASHDAQRRFESAGPGWPPLAESTEASKARRGGGPSRILVDTGTLMGSFEKGGTGNITKISPREAEFGSNVFYGVFHQEGRGVPKRTIIEITGEQEAKYSRIAADVQSERIRALGFQVS